MDFIALDFETANSNRSSACSVGIAVVKNSIIVDNIYELIRPEPFYFDQINISIHGIREEDVINKPSFSELYHNKLEHLFQQYFVIAHNASFDMSVLRHSLGSKLFGLSYEVKYLCSLVISRLMIPDSTNHKLNTLCDNFGITLDNHHNALDDAIACAKLFLNLASNNKISSIGDFLKAIDCDPGLITPLGYKPFSSSYSRFQITSNDKHQVNQSRSSTNILLEEKIATGREHFRSKKIVISGIFSGFERNELKSFLKNCDADVVSSISTKTSMLIAGDKMGPAKLEKATNLGIKIISEEEFIQLINQ